MPLNAIAKFISVIVYGPVAGFAATTVRILGPMLLALFFGWIFDSLGWIHARDAAGEIIAYSLLLVIIGLGSIVGVMVCVRVWITRLRGTPTP